MVALEKFSKTIGYQFRNISLLQEALTHPSVSVESKKDENRKKNYERLEFLGDTVLALVVAEFLLELFPNEAEGDLAKRHAGLVCGETLTAIAQELHVGDYLTLSSGEETTGGRENPANLENALEALMGALYLDGGIDVAKTFVKTYWHDKALEMKEPPKDPKTALQEWSQGKGLPIPAYKIIKTEGPPHAPLFTVEVSLPKMDSITAQGSSKRAAEREAAKTMLEHIEKNG